MDVDMLMGGQDGPSTSCRDPERFYCPFPGCNRSFAELWRLKVHYRAPPDIRGSGKERGHGTELTHCPKCGKTLKPGKHHVGCSGGKTAPRAASRRKGGDAEDDDDEPPSKLLRALEPEKAAPVPAFPWPGASDASYGQLQQVPGIPQPGSGQNGRTDFAPPPQQPDVFYGQPPVAMHYWPDPNQPNGMVHAGVYSMHGQPMVTHYHPGMPMPGYPGAPPMYPAYGYMQMPPPQQHHMQGGQIPMGGLPQLMHLQALPPQPMVMQQPPQHQSSWPHPVPAAGTSAGNPGQPPQPLPQQPQQLQAPQQQQQQPGGGVVVDKPPGSPMHNSDDALVDTGPQAAGTSTGFARVPSPPPLPADFHAPLTGAGTGFLFNFSQFSQKFPRSHSRPDLPNAGLETPDPDLLVDHHDDGDLMQLLFGLPDDIPTMATIHLHKWAPGDGSNSGSGALTPPFRPRSPQRTVSLPLFQQQQPEQAMQAAAVDDADAGPSADGRQGAAPAADAAAHEGLPQQEQQAPGRQPQHLDSAGAASGSGLNPSEGAGAGGAGPGPSRLARTSSLPLDVRDIAGQTKLGAFKDRGVGVPGSLLTNGHLPNDDHLLDAETQRLLTCD